MQVFDRWYEVEKLFHAALEQDPAHRKEFLSKTCSDPELLAEVISLLEAHEKGASTFDRPPDGVVADLLDEMEARDESLVGSAFEHYEITGLLGKGGMGSVYLARDSRLMRNVAIKILPSSQVSSLDGLRRFAQEARVASALNHPNIITVYDYGQALSSYYIATEYVDGQTLRTLMEGGLGLEKTLDISIQIASAMAAAHRSGIIHRDIKPENIMVRADGLVKILDFGLAKISRQLGSTGALIDSPASIPGAIIGTFYYMSPEQARGQELDARTDVFSFGIVLYEMLAGRRPFEGDTLPDLFDSLLRKEAPPLSSFVPDVPAEMEAIAARTLARNAEDRYQTFSAIADDLSAIKRRLDLGEKLELARPGQAAGRVITTDTTRTAQAPYSESPPIIAANRGIPIISGRQFRLRRYMIAAVVLVAAALSYRMMAKLGVVEKRGLPPPTASQPRPITNGITASIAAVAESSDGKFFAYVQQDMITVMRMPVTSQDRPEPARPPVKHGHCSGLTFSNDGSYLYYVAAGPNSETHNLYRIPALGGGQEEEIKADVNKSISFSPDGRSFVFVRNSKHALMVANADGSGERILKPLTAEGDLWLYPAWSPDNSLVACAVMNQNREGQRIYAVSLKDGSMKPIGEKPWMTVLNLAWMTGGRGLIASAAEDQAHAPGLWYISYPDARATKITNDPYGYYGASLTADSGTLLSIRGDLRSRLYIADARTAQPPKEINLGLSSTYGRTGLCWTPDKKVIYNAGPAPGWNLYEIDPLSGTSRRLTDQGSDSSPCVTPDNRFVVFTSDRSGKLAIWRTDRDGAHPLQLAAEGLKPACLFDGKWVVYQVMRYNRTRLWKAPIDGGAVQPLTGPDVNGENASVSPDGTKVAFLLTNPARGAKSKPQIAVFEDGKLLPDRYPLPDSVRQPIIRWRGDQTLVYIDEFGKSADIWEQNLNVGAGRGVPPARRYDLAHPEFKSIVNFDWSKGDRILLSAGADPNVDVHELTLTRQSSSP